MQTKDQTLAIADQLRGRSRAERNEILSSLTDEQAAQLLHDWEGFWARPNQLAPPGDWFVWLVLAGRGFGKTRIGAEWVRAQKDHVGRIALVAPTAADARDVMVEGESGILAISPPWERPIYTPSTRRLTWPNGSIATLYSADEPDRLRGPQHGAAWCDEIAAWKYGQDAFDMLTLGMRLGSRPRITITTTPRPSALIRSLVQAKSTALTRGRTRDNLQNLAPTFADAILSRYEGTSLGRQELDAELLDEMPGAMWTRANIDRLRVKTAPTLVRVVVAVDPAVSSHEGSDETGIIVVAKGEDGHGYVLADRSLRGSPDAWARAAVDAYHEFKADRLVAEKNQGGEMVEHTLHTVDKRVPISLVHASRGKQARAEPVAALYEQGRYHHVGGFPLLEDQLVSWVPGESSPDRLDALVWAAAELNIAAGTVNRLYEYTPLPPDARRVGKEGWSRFFGGGTPRNFMRRDGKW